MKYPLFLSILALFILSSCGDKDNPAPLLLKETVSGFVQKGPFINGTSVSIGELDTDLLQTGKSYNTQITNNNGSFEINNVELISDFVSLRSDGFYFNEVLGERSTAQITLYALSDISDKSTVNVNILSHVEKSRVEYLISQDVSFQDAKVQAQSEILDIFKFTLQETESSEILDISKEGEGNAALLAASVIFQGYRTEAELTELLSNISTDLREDGILNSNALSSQLINHAVSLNTTSIRSNLENRYADLGVEAEIPNFEEYVTNFIDSTSFEITESLIQYPASGLHGANILDPEKTAYDADWFSLYAELARGTSLKIKITSLTSEKKWFYAVGSARNWSISAFDSDTRSQTFTAIDSDQTCDLRIQFNSGEFLVEYFEMGEIEPTKTKTITRL